MTESTVITVEFIAGEDLREGDHVCVDPETRRLYRATHVRWFTVTRDYREGERVEIVARVD